MFIVIKDGINYVRLKTDELSYPYDYKGIEIINDNNEYYIALRKGYFSNHTEKTRRLVCGYYLVKNKVIGSEIEVYVYENEDGYDDFKVYENQAFLLANSTKASIVSKDSIFNNYYLYYQNDKLITNYSSLLVNGKLYDNETLCEGDRVCFHNFIFVYHKDFLYINNFLIDNTLNKKVIKEELVKYDNKRIISKNYYSSGRNELIVDELKEYPKFKTASERKIIFQIGPSITMSLSMLAIAGINVYNNYLNDQPLINSLVYILMPITMLLSGILWPVIANSSEKRKIKKENKDTKENYIAYLNKYEQDLINRINKYVNKENENFFNGTINEDKIFYLTNKSDLFLNISIGYILFKKAVNFKPSEDFDIQEIVDRITYRLNNIENCPYFVDIKKYKAISIVSKKSMKVELLKRFLIELSSKYHYDDFFLAIYSEDLNAFANLYGLPQLIINNNRLTISKKREIQEINNLKIDKPLILLANDRIDFKITNSQIHLIQFSSDRNNIYKDSELLIEYENSKGGYIYADEKLAFSFIQEDIDYKNVSSILSPYQKVNFMKKSVSFKDIFKDFNIKSFYQSKQYGLRADFAIVDKEVLSFDLHESRDGPHGLIGGSTGSGKSELIVSLLLSLCIRYRPDYLNIILIDYKGGGIEESLSYRGLRIPHIIASIDNLEDKLFDRLIVAIDYECKKRQTLFKELSNKSMRSIMNIDEYLESDYRTYNLPPIAHLLIVVDEFAELKKNNPEVIKELISFSRIGRSLGVHLILATQRPNGVIDDEIWSNSRFKIALKLFSEKDSNDIIKNKAAAYLNNPGEFYLSIDDNLIKANSIYSKKDVNNLDKYEVALLDNRLNIIDKKSIKHGIQFSEASYITYRILETTKNLLIDVNKLNFEKPFPKTRMELLEKYGYKKGVVLGEIDDYFNNKKGLALLNDDENNFIFSTRNNEIDGLINNIKKQMIIIGSKKYESKYVSDSLLYDNIEDIFYLFKKIMNEKNNKLLIIEDLSCLLSYDENISGYLYQIVRRKTAVNVIAISKQSNISFKLLNCFNNKYAITINENQDLINLFSLRSQYKEKSFLFDDGLVPFIPCKEERFISGPSFIENYVDIIPERVKFEKNTNGALIGYSKVNRHKIFIKNNEKILICSLDETIIEKYQGIYHDFENIEVKLYNKELVNEERNAYLWIGDGLYNQRLFFVDAKRDLLDKQGYYLKGNKGEIIRIVDE